MYKGDSQITIEIGIKSIYIKITKKRFQVSA